MKYTQRLEEEFRRTKSVVCLGLDPILEHIPKKDGSIRLRITSFLGDIIEGVASQGIVNTVKPNYAFFAQYGFEGLYALADIIELCKKQGFIVILDAKRGDIGKTAQAYATESFDFWGVDALTVSPYLGYDSIEPYLKFSDRGIYVLAKTSNQGSKQIQDALIDNKRIFEIVMESFLNVGFVVGATHPDDVRMAARLCQQRNVPLLIPGIGTQGGNILAVRDAVKIAGSLVRVNSSSAILYAYEKLKTSFVEAALGEIEELHTSLKP